MGWIKDHKDLVLENDLFLLIYYAMYEVGRGCGYREGTGTG